MVNSKKFFKDLNKMRISNSVSDSTFKASDYWADVNNIYNDEFQNLDFDTNGFIKNLRTSKVNRRFSGYAVENRKIFEMFMFFYYKNLKSRDKHNIISKISDGEPDKNLDETHVIDNINFSVDLLFSLDNVITIAEYFPEILSEELVVADLGAGWGGNGYILNKVNKKISYNIFDLPEGLAISQNYLPNIINQKNIHLFNSDLTSVSREYFLEHKLGFFGSQQLEIVKNKSIDLFINVQSFQEMRLEQIKKYFELINHKTRGYFYTKNYIKWTNHIHKETIGIEDYPWKNNWIEKIKNNSENFQNHFVALFKIE